MFKILDELLTMVYQMIVNDVLQQQQVRLYEQITVIFPVSCSFTYGYQISTENEMKLFCTRENQLFSSSCIKSTVEDLSDLKKE